MVEHTRRFSLRGLRAFRAAAEHRTFREAAETLFITASAVSHQVKGLESELGTTLFERKSRSVELTRDGERLYSDVQPLLQELDSVLVRHRQSNGTKTLRLSVQPFFASELFVPALNDFTKQHSDIDIRIATSDEAGEKHPADADVSIRVFSNLPRHLEGLRLFPLRLIPVASPGLCRAIRAREAERHRLTLISHESRSNAWNDWEKISGIRLPKNATSITLSSMIAIARAAERGLGLALVPDKLSDSWLKSGALERLYPQELLTDDAFYFVHRTEDQENEYIALLRHWVLQKFAVVAE